MFPKKFYQGINKTNINNNIIDSMTSFQNGLNSHKDKNNIICFLMFGSFYQNLHFLNCDIFSRQVVIQWIQFFSGSIYF